MGPALTVAAAVDDANIVALMQKNDETLNKSFLLMLTRLVSQTVSKPAFDHHKKYNELHLVNEYTSSCTII